LSDKQLLPGQSRAAPVLQFIDRPKKHGIFAMERHMPVKIMGVEGASTHWA
jgi:hypothetical protein